MTTVDPETVCRLLNLEFREDIDLVRPIATPGAPARAEPCRTVRFGRTLGPPAERVSSTHRYEMRP